MDTGTVVTDAKEHIRYPPLSRTGAEFAVQYEPPRQHAKPAKVKSKHGGSLITCENTDNVRPRRLRLQHEIVGAQVAFCQ